MLSYIVVSLLYDLVQMFQIFILRYILFSFAVLQTFWSRVFLQVTVCKIQSVVSQCLVNCNGLVGSGIFLQRMASCIRKNAQRCTVADDESFLLAKKSDIYSYSFFVGGG